MSEQREKAELLAPAGDFQTALVAFDQGADAVYLGLSRFSARAKAANFSLTDLERLKTAALKKNKKIYVALNTLLKASEIPSALELVFELERIGIDALIVQDLYLLKLVRTHFPKIILHASTQMALGNCMGLQMAHKLGIKRVILPRETSISDLKKYIGPEAKRLGLELEMFIQGALCYSYSGLCLFSGLTLGTERSGNRGSCAQMCRSYYETSESKKSYPFSCHDMSAGNLIKELHSLGVISFKIEGRLKGASYVAANLAYYRTLLEGKNLDGVQENKALKEIRLNFARKFSLGHLKGSHIKQELVNKNYPKNLGVFLGKINKFNPKENSIQVEPLEKVNKNDRLLILKPGFNEKGLGLSIREVKELKDKGKGSGQILCYLYSTDKEINVLDIREGDELYLIQSASSKSFMAQDEKKFSRFKSLIKLEASYDGSFINISGSKYSLEAQGLRQNTANASWTQQLNKIFSETGESSYTFELIFAEEQADYFIPQSSLKALRNQFMLDFKRPKFSPPLELEQKIIHARAPLKRLDCSLQDGTPYAHLSHLKKALMSDSLENFSIWEKKKIIPLLPVIDPADEGEYQESLLKLLLKFSEEKFLLGLDHVSHLVIAERLREMNNVEFFADAHAYSLPFSGKILFSYENCESDATSPSLSPLYVGTPLMISKVCYLKNNLYKGDCSLCQYKNCFPYQTEIKNNQRSFKIHIYDCLNYLISQ